MRCVPEGHTVPASYKFPRSRRPCRRSPKRSRSTARQQSSWVERLFVPSLPSSTRHLMQVRGRGIQHLREDCRRLERDIRLWSPMFGLRLNESSWRLPPQYYLLTYNTISDTFCIYSESRRLWDTSCICKWRACPPPEREGGCQQRSVSASTGNRSPTPG